MRQLLLSILVFVCLFDVNAQVSVTISNPTSMQRSELVAISAAQLGIKPRKGVVVRDAFNIEQLTQWTHDGQLLLDVHIRPNSQATYTIREGNPAVVERSWVSGRMYPERLEDIAFENDRIGFRLYGPALQKRGDKGFGHDVWVKRTTELVLDELYRNDPRLSFHLDYGKALDCYGVGPSLGCGTPCLLRDGKIVFPWCYETYKILDKGPLRFTVQVNFPATTPEWVPSGTALTEHRILSLDKGSNFCEATVWYTATTPDGFPSGLNVAAGLAIRSTGPAPVVVGDDYVHYADPTVDPERHQYQIFTALLFPDANVDIRQQDGHALGIWRTPAAGRFHYFFGAAWSEFDIRSQGEWQLRIDGFMKAKREPLVITVNK